MEHKGSGWAALIIAVVLGGAVFFGLYKFTSIDDLRGCGGQPGNGGCAKADAIIVVSGGDTAARTDEAVALFKGGWASKLVVSGAAQDTNGPSNAAAMRQRSIDSGVPAHDILLDETARNTNQNASGAAQLARQNQLYNIIVVTSPYHLARVSLVFERAFASFGSVRSHPSGYDSDWSAAWWLTPRGWWLVGGELLKTSIELAQGERPPPDQ